ncbi:siderophore-interacting protein [Actinocorallia libanotica]|uniref:Siderophore-interacting protein n=1 Tax=Actinocorallia libanotica TaxID=46162 RepID=A0ABP4C935_9ACTN
MDRSSPRERVASHHREGSGVVRIGYPICIRTATVLRRTRVTPNIIRVTVGGPGLEGFHSYQADDHVRIILPDPDGTFRLPVPNGELTLDWPHPSPVSRKYTVRRYDAAAGELDIDVVVHEGGAGSAWASDVEVGDEAAIAGPPGAKTFPHNYDHYVFAVDATALPAAARWLEESPADTSAHLVIETDDVADHAYPLAERAGVSVTWLVRSDAASALAETVQALDLPDARTFLFVAGEADDIKPLRAWSKGRLDSLFTGYWKRGVADLDD